MLGGEVCTGAQRSVLEEELYTGGSVFCTWGKAERFVLGERFYCVYWPLCYVFLTVCYE